jgi:hypothetical protein
MNTLDDFIRDRNISEVLHFTTNSGILGILAQGAVLSRSRLKKEKYLEHICKYNCADRSRDADWHDYVNLSITSVNPSLFSVATGKWHARMDGWWCILSFCPEIITHEGVYFTTTNNMYSGVSRVKGAGIANLFVDRIWRYNNFYITRSSDTAENQPTCNQAEILYPGQIAIEHLRLIYVREADHVSAVKSMIALFPNAEHIKCIERSDLFP